MGFSSKQKAFCVENYSLLRSPKQVRFLFCKKYGLENRSRSGILTAKSIRRWYEQFNVSGCLSVSHKRRGMSYAKLVRCGENIEAVLMSVEATTKKSVRRRSAELVVSQSSVHGILRHDLKINFRSPRTDPGKCFAEKNHVCLVLKTSERGGRLFEIGVVQ